MVKEVKKDEAQKYLGKAESFYAVAHHGAAVTSIIMSFHMQPEPNFQITLEYQLQKMHTWW